MANKISVIAAFATFTPALTPRKLTLTAALANLPVSKISSIVYAAYTAGVDGITTFTAPTAVVGATYYLTINYQLGQNGVSQTWTGQFTATVTTAATLASGIAATDANQTNPFTITSSSSTVTITNVPTNITGYYTGELIVNSATFTCSDGSSVSITVGNSTSNTYPVGNPNVIIRDLVPDANVTGTINTGHTYDSYYVTIEDSVSYPAGQYIALVDLDATYATGALSYVQTGLKCIQSVLGYAQGAALNTTATVTSATTVALIPSLYCGSGSIPVTVSGTSGYFCSLPSGLPVGASFITTASGAFKLAKTGSETINGGTTAVTIADTEIWVAIKTTSTGWIAYKVA